MSRIFSVRDLVSTGIATCMPLYMLAWVWCTLTWVMICTSVIYHQCHWTWLQWEPLPTIHTHLFLPAYCLPTHWRQSDWEIRQIEQEMEEWEGEGKVEKRKALCWQTSVCQEKREERDYSPWALFRPYFSFVVGYSKCSAEWDTKQESGSQCNVWKEF